MFKAKDVDGILAEGEDWIERLNRAANLASTQAETKNTEIGRLTVERNELDAKANRGTVVAKRFEEMLEVE